MQNFCDELDYYLRISFQDDVVNAESQGLLKSLQEASEFCYIVGGFPQIARGQSKDCSRGVPDDRPIASRSRVAF